MRLLYTALAVGLGSFLVQCGGDDNPAESSGKDDPVITPGLGEPFAGSELGIGNASAVAVAPDGKIYVCNLTGRGSLHFDGEVLVLNDTDGDGVADSSVVFADDLATPVGLAFSGGEVYVSTYGAIQAFTDTDDNGRADVSREVISLLAYGMHVNNGIVIGPDERLYVAVGSEFNLETGGAQVRSKFLSVNLDGSDLRVFAHGVRNAYDFAFSDVGALFATDNGPDGEEINALEAAEPNTWLFPEELNHIVEDGDYGFPGIFGTPPTGNRTIGPIAEWETHAGAQGLVFNSGERFLGYEGHLFVALYHAGRIDAVELVPNRGTYDTVVHEVLEFPCVEGQVFPQPTGHRDCAHMHPLDLDLDADGNLFIAAFGSINSDLSTRLNGAVYKVSAF